MSAPPPPSLALVKRVMAAECDYTLARLTLLADLPGNPTGVACKRIGGAYAFSSKFLPRFNRVVGLEDNQADLVPELVSWFADRDIAGVFELMAGIECPRVMEALARAGYAQSGFHSLSYGPPAPAPTTDEGVSVEIVMRETLETFLDTYARGWSVGEPEGFKNNVRGWLGLPGWTLYLGRYRGAPAGAAILYVAGGVGYCADSSVDPAFRGHGVHQALLRRRMADAGAQGADLVCAMAAYLSTSHRNMIRAGLCTLQTKAIWTPLQERP